MRLQLGGWSIIKSSTPKPGDSALFLLLCQCPPTSTVEIRKGSVFGESSDLGVDNQMNHQFNTEHAILFGLPEAIFINNFHFWLRQNAANERNIRNGKPWTYNTHKAYCKQFPYMSENQIRRVLESLVSQGILEKAKFNDNKYDHTLWYSFTDEFLGQNPLLDMAKKPDRAGLKPESHTDKKTDKETNTPRAAKPRSPSSKKTLQVYLEECKAQEVKPIPDGHASKRYAEAAGIPREMLAIMWLWFKEHYTTGNNAKKTYTDWAAHFSTAVKGNWGKLWYVSRENGEVLWTSEGLVFKNYIEAQEG